MLQEIFRIPSGAAAQIQDLRPCRKPFYKFILHYMKIYITRVLHKIGGILIIILSDSFYFFRSFKSIIAYFQEYCNLCKIAPSIIYMTICDRILQTFLQKLPPVVIKFSTSTPLPSTSPARSPYLLCPRGSRYVSPRGKRSPAPPASPAV
jgi:hypothetical protein